MVSDLCELSNTVTKNCKHFEVKITPLEREIKKSVREITQL